MKIRTCLAIAWLLVANSGLAQQPSNTIDKITLTPQSGAADVEALSAKGTLNGTDFFSVQMQAELPDGALVRVHVITISGDTVPMGQIMMLNGYGELRRINELQLRPLALTSAVDTRLFGLCGDQLPVPLSEIQTVRLVHRRAILAEGSF